MKDAQDGYSFVYPFGWQEVAVKGQDVVYKDVIEPLESVSVSISKTDKDKVSEFGAAPEARACGLRACARGLLCSREVLGASLRPVLVLASQS